MARYRTIGPEVRELNYWRKAVMSPSPVSCNLVRPFACVNRLGHRGPRSQDPHKSPGTASSDSINRHWSRGVDRPWFTTVAL